MDYGLKAARQPESSTIRTPRDAFLSLVATGDRRSSRRLSALQPARPAIVFTFVFKHTCG
jgi:hypothetical protein